MCSVVRSALWCASVCSLVRVGRGPSGEADVKKYQRRCAENTPYLTPRGPLATLSHGVRGVFLSYVYIDLNHTYTDVLNVRTYMS